VIDFPTHLTDPEILAATPRLAADERTASAAVIAHLAEIDRRKLAVAAGLSLFEYCCRTLSMSEDAACNRTTAVRVVRAFPPALPMLADGRLNLSTMRILAPYLTAANHADLLAGASRRSKRFVEELVARRFPRDVATAIRKMPSRSTTANGRGVSTASAADPMSTSRVTTTPIPASGTASSEAASPGGTSHDAPSPAPRSDDAPSPSPASPDTGVGPVPVPDPATAVPPRPVSRQRAVTPMAEDVFLIRLAASGAMVGRLRHAQDLLSHAVPRGDVTEVFDRALKALIVELEKKKTGAGIRSRLRCGDDRAIAVPRARYITVDVRRAVWIRDGGRCAYISPDGRRCEARAFLQFHHLKPHEVGGPPTVENIALRCRAHNQYEADVYFAPFRKAMSDRDSIRPGADGRTRAADPTRSAGTGSSATGSSGVDRALTAG
jgi:hypothetical protein